MFEGMSVENTSYNVPMQGQSALLDLSGWLPTIIVVLIAVVVLALLMGGLNTKIGNRWLRRIFGKADAAILNFITGATAIGSIWLLIQLQTLISVTGATIDWVQIGIYVLVAIGIGVFGWLIKKAYNETNKRMQKKWGKPTKPLISLPSDLNTTPTQKPASRSTKVTKNQELKSIK